MVQQHQLHSHTAHICGRLHINGNRHLRIAQRLPPHMAVYMGFRKDGHHDGEVCTVEEYKQKLVDMHDNVLRRPFSGNPPPQRAPALKLVARLFEEFSG